MKKTRTLVLALALASFTPVFADVKYDALRPQEIITVAEGRTISNSAASFTVDLAQEQIGKKTNNRTAIVKDGLGTWCSTRMWTCSAPWWCARARCSSRTRP